jgi:hypothetical protein
MMQGAGIAWIQQSMKRREQRMPKEFNLNKYVYTEEHVNFSQWMQAYQPLPNTFNEDAKFSGLLYGTSGPEWEHVMGTSAASIWTVFEEDGMLKMRNGYQVRGRIGHVLTNRMHNAHITIMVDGLSREMLEHQILEDH